MSVKSCVPLDPLGADSLTLTLGPFPKENWTLSLLIRLTTQRGDIWTYPYSLLPLFRSVFTSVYVSLPLCLFPLPFSMSLFLYSFVTLY